MGTNKDAFFWDSYASQFDAIYGTKNSIVNTLINKLFRGAMRIRFEKTINSIPCDNVSVIDIGCGPGHFCFALAKCDKRDIHGVDFSEKMIGLASNHARELGLKKKVTFEVVNFLEYDTSRKYDYSIMMGFIEYFENPEIVLKKALEITNKQIFISFPVAGGLLAYQRKLRYKRRCYLRLYSSKDITELMNSLNVKSFKIEKIERDFFVTVNVS